MQSSDIDNIIQIICLLYLFNLIFFDDALASNYIPYRVTSSISDELTKALGINSITRQELFSYWSTNLSVLHIIALSKMNEMDLVRY